MRFDHSVFGIISVTLSSLLSSVVTTELSLIASLDSTNLRDSTHSKRDAIELLEEHSLISVI